MKVRGKAAMNAADPKFSDRLFKIDWSGELRWESDGLTWIHDKLQLSRSSNLCRLLEDKPVQPPSIDVRVVDTGDFNKFVAAAECKDAQLPRNREKVRLGV
jgi:hypothetical protein